MRENNVRYGEVHRLGEDFSFAADLLVAGAKAEIIPTAGYIYTLRRGELTMKEAGTSRTSSDPRELILQSDIFLEINGKNIGVAERNALNIRRKQLVSYMHAYDLKVAFTSRKFASAVKKALFVPAVWPYIVSYGLRLLNTRKQKGIDDHP